MQRRFMAGPASHSSLTADRVDWWALGVDRTSRAGVCVMIAGSAWRVPEG